MSFLEHLEDLRKRLFWSAFAVAGGFLLCWWKAKPIFNWLAKPVLSALPPGTKLAYTQLTEPFMLYINIALLAGVFVASPVILYQIWLFVAPGLYRNERRWVWPFVDPLASLFFVGGGYFGYAVGFPMVAQFLVSTGADFMPVLKIDDYLDITSKILLGMGLVFETPILIFFLARMGVVTEKWLLAKFRYAVLDHLHHRGAHHADAGHPDAVRVRPPDVRALPARSRDGVDLQEARAEDRSEAGGLTTPSGPPRLNR